MKVRTVALVGGTHGNEFTGAYLVKKWQADPSRLQRPGLSLELVLANPKAFAACRRYVDEDLNRCFSHARLAQPNPASYESMLAQHINRQLGPKGNARVDFIIDMHSATSPMGTNLVFTHLDGFHLRLAAYVKQRFPETVVTSEDELVEDQYFLNSIAQGNVLVEMGPVPQGCLRADLLDRTERVVMTVLDFLADPGRATDLPSTLEVFHYTKALYLPTDADGNINAMVHPRLLDQAYPVLEPGAPVFVGFDGREIPFDGPEPVMAGFVNEAAYYDKKMAMYLMRQETVRVPDTM
ncbi:MAG: aspartoacylase [Myxococcales bacterium]|nr:aspartoacylase [Myxococcales bacterium]